MCEYILITVSVSIRLQRIFRTDLISKWNKINFFKILNIKIFSLFWRFLWLDYVLGGLSSPKFPLDIHLCLTYTIKSSTWISFSRTLFFLFFLSFFIFTYIHTQTHLHTYTSVYIGHNGGGNSSSCIYRPHVSAIKFIGPVILDRSNSIGRTKKVHTHTHTNKSTLVRSCTLRMDIVLYIDINKYARVYVVQSSYKIITVTDIRIKCVFVCVCVYTAAPVLCKIARVVMSAIPLFTRSRRRRRKRTRKFFFSR